MIGTTRITAQTTRPVVAESKLKWLGTAAGFDFAEYDGREYCVDRGATLDIGMYSKQPGEILIGKQVTEVIGGNRFEHHNHHRATPAAAGTYAALAAKAADRKAKLERKPEPRLLDALGGHTLLARRADGILPIAERPSDLLDERLSKAPDEAPAGLLVSVRSKAPAAIRLTGREPRRGVTAILEVLQSKGVTLALTDAGTMFALGPRLTGDVRSLIEQSAPLLHAHLQDQPLRCELEHPEKPAPEAVSLLVGGAAACEQHLAGEVEP
jgi:hypothetical protein